MPLLLSHPKEPPQQRKRSRSGLLKPDKPGHAGLVHPGPRNRASRRQRGSRERPRKGRATYPALPASAGRHGARADAPIRRSNRAGRPALTIQIVANEQRDVLRKQQRTV